MTDTSKLSVEKIQLLVKKSNSSQEQQAYDIKKGAHEPLRIQAQSATRYELIDLKSERAPQHVRAKRVGRDLEIFLEGSDSADIVIEQYYDEGIVQFPKDSLTGITGKGDLAVYVIDEGLQPALSTLEGQITPIVLLENAAWVHPAWAFAGVTAVGMWPSDSVASAPAPAAPTANLATASDTGISPTDHLTSDNTPTLVGTGKAGDAITIKNAAGQTIATTVVAADGTWSATPTSALPDGEQTLSITETDPTGKTSTPTTVDLVIDTQAPAAPNAAIAASSDTGILGDGITTDTMPTLSGTGTNGDTITVVMPSTGEVLTVVVAHGVWSVTPTHALPTNFSGNATITATDPAGNVSAPTQVPITLVGDFTITGSVTAGPVSGGVSLVAYDNAGAVMGSANIQSDGTFTIVSLGRGDYRGAVLVKATDSNGNAVNYKDEVTAADKNMGGALRALSVAQEGQTQFTVNARDAALVIHITPATELAVLKAGITSDVAPANAATVLNANQTVAKLLGIVGVDITASPVATNSAGFDATNGLSNGEKYGLLLTKLSGLDSLNGGSIAVSLTQLAQSIDISSNGTISPAGLAMLDQGRQQALNALKAAPSSAEKTFLTDSTLNRQLLGDVIVTAQAVNGTTGKLEIAGMALPGSTVQVTLPDGTTQSAMADSAGHFTLISVGVQPTLETPLQFTGTDALSQPAAYTAPAAPQINIGNGQVITGTGTPGSIVSLTLADGTVLRDASGVPLKAVVDALGQWQVVPATPLSGNASLRASAVDAQGNVSSAGAAAVDVNQVSLRVPEAADGYINAAEKASGGINLQIGLPTSAHAGDSISTVVTLPNGSTLTLVDVLTASQIAVGAITRTLTPAQLATDGLYNAAISLVTQVGQSAPVRQSFIVDATAPAAPVVSPSNGQIINGTAEVGSTVTVRDGQGNVIGTVGPVGADGNWTLLPAQPLPNGTALSATATDVAGNTSGPGANSVHTDALLITGAIDSVGPQLGLLADGSATNDTSPQLTGTLGSALLPGQSLVVYRQLGNGTLIKVGTADIYGAAWTFQDGAGTGLNAPLADGNYTYQVVVETTAGPVNGLTPSGLFDLVVNTTRPAAPVTTVPEATGSDTFVNTAEKASDAGVPIVTQLAPAAHVGDVVTTTVTLPGGSTRTLSATLTAADIQAGHISQLLTQSNLPTDGAYQVSTTITSAVNGLVSLPTANRFTLDTSAPAAGTGALAAASDSGTLGDNLTNDNTPALSGTAEANATVKIVVAGQTYTVTANAQGTWSLPATATLPDGTYTPVITVTDAAGNSSTANGTPFTVDATAPATPGVTIPDASHGVSAAEALDGVALVVNLPGDAKVGDTVTTVVTPPGGGAAITLTHVILASELPTAQGGTATGTGPFTISQTVPQAQLFTSGSTSTYLDGAWATSSTLTDVAGNTSAAQTDGFTLAANGPTLTLGTVAGDGTVNAAEKAGDLPVTGTTSAEAGQSVKVQLLGANNAVIGTYYTTVQPDGSFALNIPQAQLPADGAYTLTANVSNFAGTPAVQQNRSLAFDTAAPAISVTSVAGDAVSATGSGTFDGTERGFNLADYTLSSTVTTPPVISGTTTAEVGQSVTVLINNVTHTTTVQTGGTWAITLTQAEAKALVHGSTYAITASVSDVAGNPSAPDTDNHLVVNIAPPDVPTVNLQYTGILTPVITGTAQKLSGSNPIALAAGDIIEVTLHGVTVTATIQASGTATNIPGVSYDPATKLWSLDTAAVVAADPTISFGLASSTYDVQVSTTTANGTLTRSDISAGELVIDTTPPAITLNPISPDASGASVINGFEQGQSVTLTGTTDAQVGATVTLTGLDGVTRTATVQAGANGGPNTFSIAVPGTAINGMADATYTPQVSVTNQFGLTGTATQSLLLDTTAPSAPTVALPEAAGGINAAEALSNGGTPLVVTLPADAHVGDTVTTVVTNPNGTTSVLSHVLVAADLPPAQGGTATGAGPFTITQTIPSSALAVDGAWTTRTTVTDTAGNASAPQSGAFVLDTAAPGVPGVALPEASNGINAAEALSNGGTPIAVTLPGDAAVGDTVTTVVTLPNGGTLTLSTVLTAADLTAGSISQLIPTSALTHDGTWATSTTVTDVAGNTSPARAGSFVLDTTAPAAPAAALASASDTGTAGDNITLDSTPTISGTGTPGDTITVTFPGGEVKTAVVAADGSWSVTPATVLADGVQTVLITATDPAGNTSPATQLPITIDTTGPSAPVAALASVSDTGVLGDALTADNTPTLSGTGNAGDTITVKDAAGNVIATAVVNANGQWSATPAQALPDGLNTLAVTATDPAGNTGPATTVPVTIDTAAPNAPAAALALASDTGTAGDRLTGDNTPSITGSGATPGDTITVTFPGGEVKTVPVASDGTWTVTPVNPLPDGLNNVSVTATDPAGNTSAATTLPLTIDTTPPAAPAAVLASASDSGTAGDGITNVTTPTLAGTGTAGDTITIKDAAGTVIATAVVGTNGQWTAPLTSALPQGLNALAVTATDPAGNTSAPTAVPVTIDTTAQAPVIGATTGLAAITGTGEPGATVTLKSGGTIIGTAVVATDGSWSVTPTAAVPNGTALTATQIDPAGNTSAPGSQTVNSVVPSVNPTNGTTLAGTGKPGDTVALTLANGTPILDSNNQPLTAVVDSTGHWTAVPGTPLANAAVVKATDTTNSLSGTATVDAVPPAAPAAALAAGSDSGTLGDSTTNITTPAITGTGTAGDTITLKNAAGTVIATAVVGSNGQWTATPTSALPQGLNALAVTATDPAGNVSAPTALSITIDTSAPAVPTAALAAGSDSGVQGDNLTNDSTPTINGTGEPNATITLKDALGNVIATAVVDNNGQWTATPVNPLPQGLNALSITATDVAGNTSAPIALPLTITIDTTAPAAPAAALTTASDTGIAGDAITANNTPTIAGTGTAGDTITLKDANGNVLGTVVVAPNGSWSITPTSALTDGLHNLAVTATDPAGNTGPATTVPVTIDTTAPVAPVAALASTSDSGTLGDSITTDNTPTITGTGTAGDTITLKAANGTVLGTAVVAANGSWAITPTTALPDGLQNFKVTATDPQGNVSPITVVPVTIDTSAPAAPAAALASVSDSGTQGDSLTNDTTPTLSGTAEPNTTVTVKDAAGNVIATASVGSNGQWTATPANALPQGLNTLSVTVTDAAGNTSAPALVPVTIDTAAAAPAIVPTNGSGAITGTGEPGATVTLKNGSTVIGTAVVAPDGSWSVTPTAAVPDTTVLSASQVDAAGNASTPATTTVNSNVPNVNPTNGALLTGTGKPGDLVALTRVDGTPITDASGAPLVVLVQPDGTWSAAPGTPLANGVVVKATDTTSHLSGTATVDAQPPAAPAAALAAGSDSGTLGDSTTNIATPAITGTGTAGDTITVKDAQGNVIATAVVGSNGQWTATPTSALPEGLNALAVTATDPVGNVSAPTALPITIDTTAPAAPTAALAAISDSGTLGDGLTNVTTPNITGTGVAGDTITIKNAAGTVIATATVDSNGQWTAPVTSALPQGLNNLAVTATDPAGNTSAPAALPLTITIDTSAPAAPTAALAAISDSGTLGDGLTNVSTPTLSGTGTVGDTITIKNAAGTVIGTATVGSNGQWSTQLTSALPQGLNNLAVTATDPAGNTSPATAVPVTIDTSAPSAPTVVLPEAANGVNAAEAASLGGTPIVTTLPADAKVGDTVTTVVTPPGGGVAITLTHVILATELPAAQGGTATGAGPFTVSQLVTSASLVAQGAWTTSTTLTDVAGNTSAATAGSFTLDTQAPAAPAAALAAGSDSGTAGDGITSVTTPTLAGTGTAGDTITIKDANGNVVATATVDSNGQWTAPLTSALPQGLNNLAVTATDPAGNTSPATTVPVTIDTTALAPVIAATNGFGSITGTGEPGATVTLKNGNTVIGTAVVAPDGSWSVTPTAAVPNGTALASTQIDAAGNTSAPGNQTVDANVPVVNPTNGTALAGTGKPGDTLALTLANGTPILGSNNQPLTAVVDSTGHWTAVPGTPLPNAAVVKATDTTNNLSGTATVDAQPPAAPAAALAAGSDSGTLGDSTTNIATPAITGTGTAGDTITVKDAQGNVIATAVVGSNGQWTATPTSALAQGLNTLAVTATDPVGNVSAPTALPITIDTSAPSAPSVALPEAVNGVNAAEAASLGGTPITTNLPSDAKVGDTVTTVVTNPNGTTTTLTHVILAAELPAAQGGNASGSGPFTISQVIPSTALTVDGAWTTSTTIKDVAGNTSGATAGSFTLDTTAPSAPTVALPEAANSVNAAEAASLGGTPITTTLPSDAKVGDTVTTVVTNPNGTTTTLSHVILAAELPTGQGGTATGSGPFTISQLIPSAALTVDGAWTTSTTLTDVAGNTSAAAAGSFTLDTTAPSAPTVALPEAANGVNAAEAASLGGTPIVTTLPADAKVGDTVTTVVTPPGGGAAITLTHVILATELPAAQGGTATGAGPFTVSQLVTSASLVAQGAWTTSTTITDVAGNTSAATAGSFTLDTQAPAAPTAVLAPASDTGTLGDGITANTTPVISGTGTNGDTITVVMPGTGEVLTAVVVGGVWSVTPTHALADGTVGNAVVTATDPAGNVSAPANVPLDIQLSPVALAITSITTDTGISGTDHITNDTTPTITGTSDQPNRPVTVTIGGVSFTVMTDNSGNWTVDTGALNATSGTWNKATGFTTDGLKNITVTIAATSGNSSSITSSVTIDTTAPTVLVTSVFGDAVGASGNGTFDGVERGFNTTNYTLASTVSPLPVISGTTTAEDGQVVTVTLAGKSYTATAAAGAWSVSVPSADAVLLNHGNTYAISASVSDKAGNAAVADTNNGVLVNIAAPDVPTVVSQTTLSTTPTLTGLAQKIVSSSAANLAAGDALTVTLKDAAGTTTLGTYTLTVGGTSSPAGLSYNTTTGAWSLAVPASTNLAAGNTYNVDVSATAAGITRADISSSELRVVLRPTITSMAEVASGSALSMTEAASIDAGQTLGGTTVSVGLTSTGAVVGQVITLTWGGQTVSQVLTATDIANGTVGVLVPTSVIQAETPANTTETIAVSVSLGNGVNSLASNATINFVTPTAPTINSVAWASTGAGNTSALTGIPEAYYDKQTATYAAGTVVDLHLYYSEAVASANSGTVVRVQLPTTGVTGVTNPALAGDTLTVTWGTQTLNNITLVAGDITAKYVDVTVPFNTINSQPFGTVAVMAAVTSAASGNTSPAATVNVAWAYDLPLADLTALSGGFAINGGVANEKIGYSGIPTGAVNVGDVNGDGYDDVMISETGTTRYVVYGRPGLATVELSSMSVAGNTDGFILTGGGPTSTRAGDINGDGMNDIIVQVGNNSAYVVYGSTASIGKVALTALAANAGFKITYVNTVANTTLASPSVVGDVNGDGYDDILFNFADASGSGNFLLYGGSGMSNMTLPSGVSGTASNGFFITPANTSTISGGQVATMSGDFNGDGYSDFVLFGYSGATAVTSYVYFGGSNLTGVNATSLNTAGNGRGFAINGLTGGNTAFFGTNAGDINGDGMEDMIFNDKDTRAFVLFGKTDTSPVNVSQLTASGNGLGFVINAGNSAVTSAGYLYDVDGIGDFNGDGLADMIVADHTLAVNGSMTGGAYVVYGRTSTSALTLNNLAASEGFRIDGSYASAAAGYTSTAAGDVNGDGFADVLIMSYTETPSTGTRASAGVGRVVFGGPSRINDMVFQPLNGDAIGTTGADTLVGTTGANQLVGGDGNDTLIGAGGADVLYGGRGDDTLVINASNVAALATNSGNASQAIARIDGGNGTDTLQLMASLDLTTVSPAAIQSIERINLSSSGTTLTMGLLDVLGLSEKNNPFNTATGWTATTSGGATGWGATNVGAQVVVDGTSSNDLYLNGSWQSLGTVQHTETVNSVAVTKTYKVLSDLTNAEAQVIVDGNVKIHMAPTVLSSANELAGSLNLTEANSSGGTPVRISLVDTDAVSGNTIQLNWGGQLVTVQLSATDISNGYATLPLTTAQLLAVTPIGNSANVNAVVTLLNGTTDVAHSGGQPIAVNFTVPTTPTIDSVLWSATNTTSTLTGVPEASYALDTTTMPTAGGYVDNTLYYSEVINSTNTGSTILRVQLPTAATTAAVPTLAGDTLTVHWGDQTIVVGTVSATDITNKYKDITLSQATLETQAFGDVVVTAEVTSAASGNTSLTSPLTVKWAYDLPLESLYSLSQGFTIQGNIAGGKLGISNENQGAQNVGDVNGDGYDDLEMTDLSGNRYIVYGGNRSAPVSVGDLTAAGNTNGFMIASTTRLQPTRGGDINGDGLSDILIGNGTNSYIIFGSTRSIGKLTLATLGTNGFAFTSADSINEPSVVGDVNGDGYEDMLFNNIANYTNYLVFGGTNFTPGGSVALPTGTSGTLATGTGSGTTYVQITNGGAYSSGGLISTLHGDFNGDGYSDFALAQTPTTGIGTGPVYVYYGSANPAAWNSSTLSSPTNGRGFRITGLTGLNSIKFESTNMGDINGDGMDDIVFNDGDTRAFVLFGKTNSTSVDVSQLAAGNGGFMIDAGGINANSVLWDADVVGDFNGDGLADMVVSNKSLYVNGVVGGGAYLVYGRTAATNITLDSLAVSEGFRISGFSATAGLQEGRTVTAAGDVNGDGFADLAITTYGGEAVGATTDAGIVRVVFGGVSKLQSMTFQTANGDAIGTTGADTLTGTSGNNQLVGGDGNDTLTGAGGADVLYGGRGDDTIVVNASNVTALGQNGTSQAIARIDGGSGIDTLKLDGAGIVLDLSLVTAPAINNIEKIDLTGSGNNTLKLSLQDMLQGFDNSNVFNSSNTTSGLAAKVTSNQLMVDGDTGDKLVLTDLANWTAAGTNVVANGHTYVAYNHNTSAQQLLIDNHLLVSAT